MAYRCGQDRDQLILFPSSVDELVAADHPVRAYDAFVDRLDLEALGIEVDEHHAGNCRGKLRRRSRPLGGRAGQLVRIPAIPTWMNMKKWRRKREW